MIKLLKTTKKIIAVSSLSPLIITPLLSATCQRIHRYKDNKKDFKLKEYDHFLENKNIASTLSFYKQNQSELNAYVDYQTTMTPKKFGELSVALTWFTPFLNDIKSYPTEYLPISEKSQKILIKTLQNDWLWMLKNIHKMSYTFNPYGSKYARPSYDEFLVEENIHKYKTSPIDDAKLFNYITKLFSDSTIKLQNNKIKNNNLNFAFEIPLDKKNIQVDKYKKITVKYLFLTENIVTKLYEMTSEDNLRSVVLSYDLLYIDWSKIFQSKNEYIKSLELSIWEKRTAKAKYNKAYLDRQLKDEYEESQILGQDDPDEKMSEEEYKRRLLENEKNAWNGLKDIDFLRPFSSEYLDALTNTINKIYLAEENKWSIFKFTWRFIDEG
ncbi:aromatic motif membrane protein [Metamycoplasma equirhinis]|uniref:aromatic motif membrane protein n=1 Tax=Metamycoplasma equirhinis TaxID=92402 RepID=UPI00111D388D|nr:aromatic motif membrane protein [Metamycoplasma equirhinis]TPD99594.1 hypothetical protein FJM08_00255 [Metamycoplasma equirhinis]